MKKNDNQNKITNSTNKKSNYMSKTLKTPKVDSSKIEAENSLDFIKKLEQDLFTERDLSKLSAEEQFAIINDKVAFHPEAITPKKDFFHRLKESKKTNVPLMVKFGIDPTGPDIHIGHAVSLIMLKRFQRMGHHIQLVIGDFTARIGDPTDRATERNTIDGKNIRRNMKLYFNQASRIIDLREDHNKQVKMVFNSEWLSKITLTEWIPLLQQVSATQMIQRQDFQKRIEAGGAVSMAELMYSLFMAYDSVVLKPDVELGGADQFVNLHWCRNLMSIHSQNPETFIIVNLLPGTSGSKDDQGRLKKMSKSSKNYISVTEEPSEMYGKTMSIPDNIMWVWFRELTEISGDQLQQLRNYVKIEKIHPMDAKKMLARLVVGIFNYYDQAVVQNAEQMFLEKFGKEKVLLPSDIEAVEVNPGTRILDVLSKITGQSKSTIKKMQNGVSVLVNDDYQPLDIEQLRIMTIDEDEIIVKLGKKRYYRFVINKCL